LPSQAPSIRLKARRFAPESTTATFIWRSSSSARRIAASTTVWACCREISEVLVLVMLPLLHRLFRVRMTRRLRGSQAENSDGPRERLTSHCRGQAYFPKGVTAGGSWLKAPKSGDVAYR